MRIEELENPPQWLLDADTAFVNVEIIDGVKEGDKIKVWNKASKEDEEEEDND